jgi:DNA-binding transcriptional ArsR family regulator
MNHIDLSSVLRQTVACDLYSNLVTRPTGAAVRDQIERLLGEARDRTLTVIDFSQVSMIDFSCADEVIAKLLLRYEVDNPPREAYFLFRGVTDEHWEAIEAVLERRGLALVLEQADGIHVVGTLSAEERRAWDAVRQLGRAAPGKLAEALDLSPTEVQWALDTLRRRRLVMRIGDDYVVVGALRGG